MKFVLQHLERALRGITLALAVMLLVGAARAPLPPPVPSRCATAPLLHPKWANNAVAYGVAPRLFGRHPLRAVTSKLGSLKTLGVNVIWLSPVAETASGDYGYAVTDPLNVRRGLGTPDDLRALVAAAHARGMHVLFDIPANHLSDKSKYYVDARRRGRHSPYYAFFQHDATGDPTHYLDWENLENLDYANPNVWRFELNVFRYWLETFDADGFRADAAWAVQERAPKFWPWLNRQLKCEKPGLFMLAEASARDPYYSRAGFDAAYDWTKKQGQWAWNGAFDDPPDTAARLRAAIAASQNGAQPSELIFRFLDNNDTGARFVTRYGIERTRVASAMLLTLPGLPGLFTGDEIGAQFDPYKKTTPLTWNDSYGLRAWYRQLIDLRAVTPPLRSRAIRFLDIASGSQVLAYVRPDTNGTKNVLVFLNYGSSPVRFALPSGEHSASNGRFTDLLSGKAVSLEERHPSIVLAGYGVRILRAE